jgi:predicted NUDIX family NTP pyrophosphohydrolase
MKKQSAGILAFRQHKDEWQFCLVHPGGPFFKNKDEGSWGIPKGEFEDGEDKLVAATREFQEEMGFPINGKFIELNPVQLKSGKWIYAWAVETDFDTTMVKSNDFEIEWPPKSGLTKSFPEIDKAEWFTLDDTLKKINPAQANLIKQLLQMLNA